jgi:transposase
MKIDLKNLPEDTSLLQQMLIHSQQIIADLVSEVELLKARLALLRAKRFGKSSEKLDIEIAELELRIEEKEWFGDVSIDDESEQNEDQGSNLKKDKLQPKRKKLPESLPRDDIILEASDICPSCGGEDFRKIGDDISEVLEYIPSSFKVIRYIRPRCACTSCDQIVQAYPSSKTIDKGKAGPGLLAHVLIQKYCNHLPFYRQSEIYAREDIDISRSTMASWAAQCSSLLEPLINELKKSVFSSDQIHGDDTTVKVLAPGFGKTKTGRIWTYVRDGRPYGDTTPPAVCYFYSPDRKGERPLEHLKDFTGIMHADAYAGYDKVYEKDITEAACWAHARRKFYEITVASDNAKVAYATLLQIAKIYQIEEDIKGLDPDKRQAVRQENSKGLVNELFASFKIALTKLPQKSATCKAINYAMNNQVALMRFLDNGKIEIDNNAAERAMRSIALGRKNWLFAGSDNGGRTAAAIYSLVETAKLNNINPQLYMAKVLATIQDHNSSKIAELLPWNITL